MNGRPSDFNGLANKYVQATGGVYKFTLTGSKSPRELV
jgi:hypothetical protein